MRYPPFKSTCHHIQNIYTKYLYVWKTAISSHSFCIDYKLKHLQQLHKALASDFPAVSWDKYKTIEKRSFAWVNRTINWWYEMVRQLFFFNFWDHFYQCDIWETIPLSTRAKFTSRAGLCSAWSLIYLESWVKIPTKLQKLKKTQKIKMHIFASE